MKPEWKERISQGIAWLRASQVEVPVSGEGTQESVWSAGINSGSQWVTYLEKELPFQIPGRDMK